MKKSKKIPRSDFYRLRLKTGLGNLDKAAELCGVTTRTIQNWDKKGAPATAMRLLQLYDRKYCSGIGPQWEGFCFSRGVLIHARLKLRFTPEGLKRWPQIISDLKKLEQQANNRPNCPMTPLINWLNATGWGRPLIENLTHRKKLSSPIR
ncbi:MAG: hypothetical protein PHE55_00435 [Methylococcaceae bacterium]|nr:hypothetical protein [Methylococcaceae bacterium]